MTNNNSTLINPQVTNSDYGYGWKFLTPALTTESDEYGSFEYNVPGRGEKWSALTAHPTPAKPDGDDCGYGRLHVMNKLDARYAPKNWWPWYVRYEKRHIIGASSEKVSVAQLQLKRVRPKVFHRMLKLGAGKGANLRGADLSGANLSGANLSYANLRYANLSYANLSGANLSGADLSGADLSGADLRYANLSYANLRYANLRGANLSGANLSGADLSGANLSYANLSYANLRGANLSGANLSGARNKEFAFGLPEASGNDEENQEEDEDDQRQAMQS